MSRVPGIRRNGRALLLLPSIPDDAPDAVKDALAIRNACAIDGHCPCCGAVPVLSVDEGGLGHATFWHEPDCDALCDEDDGPPSA